MDRPTLYITRLLPQPVLDAIPRYYHVSAKPADHQRWRNSTKVLHKQMP